MMTQSRPPVPSNSDQSSHANQSFAPCDVLVFVDDVDVSETSIRHAKIVADALGGTVELLQVLCEPSPSDGPIDPVDWDIKKQQALKRLGRLSRKSKDAELPCRVTLLEGKCSSQIKSLIDLRPGDIAASPRRRDDGGWCLSETAWAVLMSQSVAVLMIPEDTDREPNMPYSRILVPLDGSLRAETVLPISIQIARAQKAELMLCYIPPDPNLTEIDANDHESDHLHRLVRDRNERAGKTYLSRTKKRLDHNGLEISVKISNGGDARRSLIDMMAREKADFVVMAMHGQSGHTDVPTGDVARFVLEKASIPVLLVRNRNGHNGDHTFGNVSSKGVRQPAGTD